MKKNEFIKVDLSVISLYILQFVIFPILLPQYYPTSNNALIIYLLTSLIANIFIVIWLTDKINYLVISDLLYGCLICIYNCEGAYGIGIKGISLDGLQTDLSLKLTIFMSLMLAIVFLAIQLLCTFIKKKIKRI